LIRGIKALPIGEIPVKGKGGWLLSLGGTWRPCKVEPFVRGLAQQNLYITDAEGGIFREMSGSPILLDDGKAIGVLSTTLGGRQEDICEHSIESHPQPILTQSLPIWILNGIRSHNGQDVSSI